MKIRRKRERRFPHWATERAYKNGRAAGAKELAERLCKGRVSNDPVVIAVNVELEEILGVEKC